jgi:hypothetical protein
MSEQLTDRLTSASAISLREQLALAEMELGDTRGRKRLSRANKSQT